MTSSSGPEALIAEVGGAGRWSQIAFTFDIVEHYFGTLPDQPYNIRLWSVSSSGTVHGVETPLCIYKPNSSNWCFELGAATNMAYPGKKTRPITVFIRKANGDYLYRLLMPGDADYGLIAGYLAAQTNVPAGRLRRLILSASDLKLAWPTSPLWEQWP